MINRLHDPTAGEIVVDGEDRSRSVPNGSVRPATQDQHGVPALRLLPHRRIVDNVAFGLEVQGMGREDRERKAVEVLEVVGLGGWPSTTRTSCRGDAAARGARRASPPIRRSCCSTSRSGALDPLIRRDMQDEVIRLQREVRQDDDLHHARPRRGAEARDGIAIMKDGRFAGGHARRRSSPVPANDYVADFTKDVPRAHVLDGARSCARRTVKRRPTASRSPWTIVQDLISIVAETDRAIRVVDDGAVVGVVDRAAVMAALVEES